MVRATIMVPLSIQNLIHEAGIPERERTAFYEVTALRSESGELPPIGRIAFHWFGALRPVGSIRRTEAIVARLIEVGLVERTEAGLQLCQPHLYVDRSTEDTGQNKAFLETAGNNVQERRRLQASERQRRHRQRNLQRDSHNLNVTLQRDKKPKSCVTERDNSVTCHAPGFLPHTPSSSDLPENKSPLPPCHGAERDIQRDSVPFSVKPEFDFEGLAADLVAAHPSPRPGRRNNLVVQALSEVWADCGGDVGQMSVLRQNTLDWCEHWRENGFVPNLARWIHESGWLTGPPVPKIVPGTESKPGIDWSEVAVAS